MPCKETENILPDTLSEIELLFHIDMEVFMFYMVTYLVTQYNFFAAMNFYFPVFLKYVLK